MLDAVICARDKWLSSNGIMAPNRLDMLVAGFMDEDYINDRYHFWNHVYGFDMSDMKSFILKDAQVDCFDPKSLMTRPHIVKSIDTKSSSVKDLDFSVPLEWVMERDGRLHGVLGWFDTYFEGPGMESIFFSTGPQATPTHWKQSLFIFREAFDVSKGDKLTGQLTVLKSLEYHRDLEIRVELWMDQQQKVNQVYTLR